MTRATAPFCVWFRSLYRTDGQTDGQGLWCGLLLLLLLLTFIWREFEKCSKSAKSTVTVCSFCHEECFQPPTKYRQWHVQSKCSWQTVPYSRTANSEAAIAIVRRRAWNRELSRYGRAKVTPTVVWWRWYVVCRQIRRSRTMPTLVH